MAQSWHKSMGLGRAKDAMLFWNTDAHRKPGFILMYFLQIGVKHQRAVLKR